MKNSILTVLLLIPFLQFTSCKNESKKAAFNEKVSLEEATTVTDTPMMLGTSIYAQLSYKGEMSAFREALPPKLKELLLGTAGPYTVFVPTNDAVFNSKTDVINEAVLKNHIVKGAMNSAFLVQHIRKDGGVFKMITISGKELKASRSGMDILIEDENNNQSLLLLTDYLAENGIVHTINTVFE